MGLKEQMQLRTRNLALRVISLCGQMPVTIPNNIVGRQLIRASCSVGSNNRVVSRAKSTADFINKLHIVEEEADESIFWLELLQEIEPSYKDSIMSLISEMNEILSIVVAARKTAKNKFSDKNPKSQIANPTSFPRLRRRQNRRRQSRRNRLRRHPRSLLRLRRIRPSFRCETCLRPSCS